MADRWRSTLVNVVSGVPQGSVWGPLLLFLFTSKLFSILEINLTGYADDFTVIAVVPSPCIRVTVTECLNRTSARAVSGVTFVCKKVRLRL